MGRYIYTLLFAMLPREDEAELRDRLSACITQVKEDGTIGAMKQTCIEDTTASGEYPEAVVSETFPGAKTISPIIP